MGRKLAWLGLAVVVLLVALSSVAQAAEVAKKSESELRYFAHRGRKHRLWPGHRRHRRGLLAVARYSQCLGRDRA